MIEVTDEMIEAYAAAFDPWLDPDEQADEQAERRLAAVFAIVERDHEYQMDKLRAAFDRAAKSRELWKQRAIDAGWKPQS